MTSALTGPAVTGVRWLSRLRGERVIHAKGHAFDAVLDVLGEGTALGIPLVATTGPRPALVRLSRGAGLPGLLPDVLGLALRVPDADGHGGVQDLLMSTAASAPVLRHLPLPRYDVVSATYSSLSPYDVGGRRLLVGAVGGDGGPVVTSPDDAVGRSFTLATAPARGPWQPFARLTVGDPLPDAQSRDIGFDVAHDAGGFVIAGPFRDLRAAAYPVARAVEHTGERTA